MIAAIPTSTILLALQEAPPRSLTWWASTIADIATIVIAVVLVIAAVVLVPTAFSAGRIYRKVNGVVDRLHGDASPILLHLRDITNNLNFISASLREDVEGLKGTIQSSQARLLRASEMAERRIDDFNALLGVVQQEAETLFIDTASTIRGVRAGTSQLRNPPREADWNEGVEGEDRPAAPRREAPRY